MKLPDLSPKRSLMARLVGSFLTVSLLTVGFVAMVAFSEARSALRNAVVERLQAAAVDRETELNQWIDRRRASPRFVKLVSHQFLKLVEVRLDQEHRRPREGSAQTRAGAIENEPRALGRHYACHAGQKIMRGA